jgi:hypothetical protein
MVSPASRLLPSALILVLGVSAACDERPAAAPPGEATARERLVDGPRIIGLLADQATISLNVRLRRADGWHLYPASLELAHGLVSLAARPDGNLQVVAARLAFRDIVVGDKGLPPNGLHLTDVRIATPAAYECNWVDWSEDGDDCSADIPVDFDLDWSLVASDGAVVPLTTQRLPPISLRVDVTRDAAGIAAALAADEPGLLWSWAGLIEFRDLELDIPGHELIPLSVAQALLPGLP